MFRAIARLRSREVESESLSRLSATQFDILAREPNDFKSLKSESGPEVANMIQSYFDTTGLGQRCLLQV
jgi:hypothetical protein